MRASPPRPRQLPLLTATAVLVALGALGGCGSDTAGDVRLRASSMTSPIDDQRLPYDSAWTIRNSPP